MIKVLKPGSDCYVVLPGKPDPIPAKVLAVKVGMGGAIKYQAAWWSDGSRSQEWLHECEVAADRQPDKLQQIGFLPTPDR